MNATVANGVSAMMKPESVSLHPLGAAAGPAPEMLCIFGTGDLGRSLGLRLLQSGYSVVYGSRRPNSCGSLPQGAQVMSHAAAAKSASLIFICVHREHYEFLETLAPHLEGKVLVDLSNNLKKDMYPEANAAYLQRLVPGAAVVKGLNTLSAWALQNGLLAGKQMKNNKTTPFYFDNTESWGTDSFYALGILGFFLYVLLGLTSLPSVGGSLSWREFSFIQSKLGHLTLFICTAHGYIYGWNKFLRPSTYKWYTPPGYMLCLIVPSVVLVLKALIILPCVDRTLTRIRQGWERNQPREEVGKATNL
ncbi:metalloreductase STEAP4-like isoform X2 [Centropristis striata]|uniref:metalloreductase STEAP4-like isoform X2 n=1 Tax=Centropristis striata TaxID=184440 RepID=UPI0027E1B931|nr:metalloreductase STEAP4-like isoform X2 [Centropristis striata]